MPGSTYEPHFRIYPLGHQYDRVGFSCGIESLDDYLHKRAGQDARNRVAAPFVLTADDDTTVIGYYTLSALSILLDDLPSSAAKRLPRYPAIPVTLLGRLALDSRYRRRGLGEHLLMDALYRAFVHSKEIASFAVVVDALNDVAAAFYARYEFEFFPDNPSRLFLTMKKISKIFQQ